MHTVTKLRLLLDGAVIMLLVQSCYGVQTNNQFFLSI